MSQDTREAAGNHFVAITDAGTPLVEEAHTKGFRYCFENPEDIGGRYAALSYVGLVAMALDRKLQFLLLSDFEPKGAVARTYGVYRHSD